MVTARTVLESRGPTSTTRLANAGSEQGVRPGHPVLSEHGVVGRVAGVTKGASRILLLTDPASKVPVLVDRTNARAILTGDGGPNPRLEFLRGLQPTREGDPLLTSGDGGVFPRGLPVGVAVRGLDGVWRARLYSDRSPVDYVRIIQFQDFATMVNEASLQTALPPVVAPVTPPPPPVTVAIGSTRAAASVAPPAAERRASPPRRAAPPRPAPAPERPRPAARPPEQPTYRTLRPSPFRKTSDEPRPGGHGGLPGGAAPQSRRLAAPPGAGGHARHLPAGRAQSTFSASACPSPFSRWGWPSPGRWCVRR
jgi:rod shape-determining protein MreC